MIHPNVFALVQLARVPLQAHSRPKAKVVRQDRCQALAKLRCPDPDCIGSDRRGYVCRGSEIQGTGAGYIRVRGGVLKRPPRVHAGISGSACRLVNGVRRLSREAYGTPITPLNVHAKALPVRPSQPQRHGQGSCRRRAGVSGQYLPLVDGYGCRGVCAPPLISTARSVPRRTRPQPCDMVRSATP